jgi:endo-1,4-beta-xylanase
VTARPGLSRRTVLAGALAGCLAAPGARAVEARWSVPYGAAIKPELLATDAAYRSAILDWCSVIVPEGSLKWAVIRPRRDAFRFEEADACLSFASANGLALRGHNLVWGEANPAWLQGIGTGEAEGVLVRHIETVVGRYAGRIADWDVVNEPMAPDGTTAGALRPSVWLDRLGPKHIDLAFRTAAAADPAARLVLNDYDIEYADAASAAKRAGLLALLRALRDRDVPIHAVGLQGHLRSGRPLDPDALAGFVAAIRAEKLEVLVTELDVIDDRLPGPAAARDEAAATLAASFLQAVFSSGRPEKLLSWGLTDRFSWVPSWYRRADGTPNRPLPLDAAYRPKPLMGVIERFCR